MVFKVELDGEVISCSSLECINRLLMQGWRLSDPAQWNDLTNAFLSEGGLTPPFRVWGAPLTGAVTRASPDGAQWADRSN